MTMTPDTWKKIGHFCLAFLLGTLGGFLSSFGADIVGLFLRPPLVFGLCCIPIVQLHIKADWGQHACYFALMFPIYWLAFLANEIMPIILPAIGGTLFVYLAFYRILRLNESGYLLAGGFTIGMALFLVIPLMILQSEIDHRPSYLQGGALKLEIIYCYWQALTLAFLSLQLYTERLHRQSESEIPAHIIPPDQPLDGDAPSR